MTAQNFKSKNLAGHRPPLQRADILCKGQGAEMKSIVKNASVLGVVFLSSVLGISAADAATCEELAKLRLSNTVITLAKSVSAGSFKPLADANLREADYAALPTFCRVAGTIKPTPD